jgi:hypothetical protein
MGDGIPFSELRLSEVRNISGEKQHVRTRARQAQCAHLTVDGLIDLMESPTGQWALAIRHSEISEQGNFDAVPPVRQDANLSR